LQKWRTNTSLHVTFGKLQNTTKPQPQQKYAYENSSSQLQQHSQPTDEPSGASTWKSSLKSNVHNSEDSHDRAIQQFCVDIKKNIQLLSNIAGKNQKVFLEKGKLQALHILNYLCSLFK